MAKVPEQTGPKSGQKSIEQRRSQLALVLTITAVIFSGLGFGVGFALRKSPIWVHALVFPAFILTLRLVFLWSRRRIEKLDRESAALTEAVAGTWSSNPLLRSLSDDFRIVNGPAVPSGHTEYLVVGKNGIFLLDTVYWKGEVTANGHGELLWNGHPTDTPIIHELEERVMQIQAKISQFTGGPKIQIQPVLVFTAAQLDVSLGHIHQVRCLTQEQLSGHLSENRLGTRLTEKEIEEIARAFTAMARSTGDQHPL